MKLFFAICIEDCKNREQEQGSQQVSSVEKWGSCMQLQHKLGVFYKNWSIVDLQCYISFRYTT